MFLWVSTVFVAAVVVLAIIALTFDMRISRILGTVEGLFVTSVVVAMVATLMQFALKRVMADYLN